MVGASGIVSSADGSRCRRYSPIFGSVYAVVIEKFTARHITFRGRRPDWLFQARRVVWSGPAARRGRASSAGGKRIKTGSSGPAPGDPAILVLLRDLEAPLCGKLPQVVKLRLHVLVGSVDADGDDCLRRTLPRTGFAGRSAKTSVSILCP